MIYNDKSGDFMDLSALLKIVEKVGRIEIENIEVTADELVINIPSAPPVVIPQTPLVSEKLSEKGVLEDLKIEMPEVEWEPPIQEYPGYIREVQFGKPKSEGGFG